MPFDLLPLGHVPKVRPYWRAGYVSPSVGCFERPSTCLRSLTGLNVSKVYGWVDTTEPWTDRVRTEVVVFAQLVEVYEKLNTRTGSS
jgi:hypothetical protein